MTDRPRKMTHQETIDVLEQMLIALRNGHSRGGRLHYRALDRNQPGEGDYMVVAMWQVGESGGVLRVAGL